MNILNGSRLLGHIQYLIICFFLSCRNFSTSLFFSFTLSLYFLRHFSLFILFCLCFCLMFYTNNVLLPSCQLTMYQSDHFCLVLTTLPPAGYRTGLRSRPLITAQGCRVARWLPHRTAEPPVDYLTGLRSRPLITAQGCGTALRLPHRVAEPPAGYRTGLRSKNNVFLVGSGSAPIASFNVWRKKKGFGNSIVLYSLCCCCLPFNHRIK